ncbi:uncharacterized protein [Heterodontus francisci]|uniref:uncharacterized protein isoform X2 n=1 Tax=Heterodontus francisci TaxID=7792 RepID=UPI00355BBB31
MNLQHQSTELEDRVEPLPQCLHFPIPATSLWCPVGQSEMKRQVSSRLDPVEAKTTLTAEDAIVRINQRIFQYEKPWRSFLIEGDIIKPLWRNAVLSESKTWQKSPDGMVRIPYKISQQYDEETRSSIIRGFKDFEKFTCVQFLPHSDEDDFISIQPIHGCYSSVGRVGGMQLISLNHQCLKKGKGVVEHEIMHSLGFWHEHARSDRDKYIKIEWKNVWPGYEHNFLKQNTNNLMSKYDYGSILHYSRTAFSKNGQPTLRKLMDTDAVIGQRIRLSELDLLKVNRLYNCTTHLKDKANLLKRLTLLYEDGSFRELGRAKEAGRLKPVLDISPGKGRVHTSAHLVMASGGNGSIINWTMTAARRYPECFLVHKCSPTSWLTKLVPAVDSTSRTAVSKEPALEASGDQMELLGVAQVHKGKTETLFPTLTELPFVQSLTTNAVTTRSLLHKMSSALTMPSLTQRPTACPKAYVTCFTEEPVLPPQSHKTVGHIELLPTFPHALKISNQTQESMLFLADSFTRGRQSLRPLNWTDPPDTYTQTAKVIHQPSPSVGFLPTVTNDIYPKRLSISHQRLKHSHQQRFPILPPVTQTQVTRLLKTVTPASEIKVPAVPGQPLIAGTGTTIAPEPLSTQIEEANNGQIRTASYTKGPTVASHTKGLASLLRTGILASCNKACRSHASLVPTLPPPTESLLVSTLPGESLLVSTRTSTLPPPPEILLVSTPPVESLLVSTPPAEPQVTSTVSSTLPPPAEKLLVTNSLAEYLLVSIPPAEYLLVSTPPAEPLLVSNPPAEPQVASTLSSTLRPPAERLLVTNTLPESLLVPTPPVESLLVSTPPAAPQVASTLSSTLPPPAESLLVSTPLAESVLVPTPPAELPLASTLTSTLLPPAETLLVSTPPAESLLLSTPLVESMLVSIPPAEPPVASILSSTLPPPAESLLESSSLAESLLASTPPAESLLVSTPPAESLLASTPPAESLLASTPPAESLLASTPPAESLLASNPPAETLLASTPPAEPPVASTLSSTLPPPAESPLVSSSLAESLLVSTPPAEPPVASTLSSTLPPPAESLLVSSSLAESLLVSTPPAVPPLPSTFSTLPPPAESLLVFIPTAGTSAFDSRSLISPLTLTRLFNPVVSNPLYDVNMISPSHSVLSDELSVELLCDFEHGLCDWEQSTTDDFDWMLHRHQTFSRETGPKRDHTKGQCKGQGGRYLYLEASYPQQSGEQAALISPLLRGQKCLAFWYNMFGKHMGSLNVFLKYENSPHWHKLWSVSGNQGRRWLNAEIDIFTNGEMYRVIIEGVLGLNYQSDAAIDDVHIYRSSCAPGKKHPPSCNRGLKKRDKSLMG